MDPPDEHSSLLIQRLPNHSRRARLSLLLIWPLSLLFGFYFYNHFNPSSSSPSIDFSHLHYSTQCEGLIPIDTAEFGARRTKLSSLLRGEAGEVSWGAYITEPSANSLYYTNISTSNWYTSERPWLLAITPSNSPASSQLSILTPSFELSRSQLLPFALTEEEISKISWVKWEEAENPYEQLLKHLEVLRQEDEVARSGESWTVQLEENVRQFVSYGLSEAVRSLKVNAKVEFASLKVREQRMRKSEAEVQIQRCAAKITLEALRAVRLHLYIGMSEKEGETLISQALTSAGLTNLGIITLFGPNAALPHATASSTKFLEPDEYALFDVDGSLLGYQSDLTRTMLPDLPSGRRDWPNDQAKKVWETVQEAQLAALRSLEKEGVRAMDYDRAARDVITREGWGVYFSHRLGHGIGLEVHEQPFENSGNSQILQEGVTISCEPGIYIEKGVNEEFEGGIGVRLEDMVLKTAGGWELLSGSELAKSPWEP